MQVMIKDDEIEAANLVRNSSLVGKAISESCCRSTVFYLLAYPRKRDTQRTFETRWPLRFPCNAYENFLVVQQCALPHLWKQERPRFDPGEPLVRGSRVAQMSQSQTKALVIGVGAERGLGAALASRFAREGHHVVVAGRALDRVENAARTIGEGGRVEHFGVDATSEADVRAVFDRASPRMIAILPISLSSMRASTPVCLDP
jgi:hypothetical protein